MQVIEIISESEGLTLRQRWANVFTIMICVLMMLLGLNLRNQSLNATTFYESLQAGISAQYPQNWLIDTDGDDYVFRVRDMSRTGFKTTFQVSVQPIGADAQERNLADRLSLDRITTFTDYRVQPLEPYTLPDGFDAQALNYTYVATDNSPFLQLVPTIVRGFDVITIRGGQAVIISYRADASNFESEFPRFEQFLRRLEF
ncbi:MAG: hypothetical protein ACFE0Q_04165 [Anaerolineae bacterium]